jgi:hypothetical protein
MARCRCARHADPAPPADLQGMSTKGYAVADVLTEVSRLVTAMKLPPTVKGQLMDKLADIECVILRESAADRSRADRAADVACAWWSREPRRYTSACARRAAPPPFGRYRLAFGTSDKLQTASLVGAFHAARSTLGQLKAASSAAKA